MNFNELLNFLNLKNRTSVCTFIEWAGDPDYAKDNNLPEEDWFYSREEMDKIGDVEMVHDERHNDIWKYVVHFLDHDIYLTIDASYDSHEGIDFDYPSIYESRPREVTVTLYDRVKSK